MYPSCRENVKRPRFHRCRCLPSVVVVVVFLPSLVIADVVVRKRGKTMVARNHRGARNADAERRPANSKWRGTGGGSDGWTEEDGIGGKRIRYHIRSAFPLDGVR